MRGGSLECCVWNVVCLCFDLPSWGPHGAPLHGYTTTSLEAMPPENQYPIQAHVGLKSSQHEPERTAHHLCLSFLCFLDCLSFLCFLSLLLSLSFFFLPCFSRIARASSTLRTVPHSTPATPQVNAQLVSAVQGCQHSAWQTAVAGLELQDISAETFQANQTAVHLKTSSTSHRQAGQAQQDLMRRWPSTLAARRPARGPSAAAAAAAAVLPLHARHSQLQKHAWKHSLVAQGSDGVTTMVTWENALI